MTRPAGHPESGIALVAVLGVMMILASLGAIAAQQASFFSTRSNYSRDQQRALAAAEAGVEVARYRVQNLTPGAGQCVTASVVAPLASGECPSTAATSLGNGATYSYTVSTSPNTQCGGPAVSAGTPTRCVTSIGTVNGATRRTQERLDGVPVPLFPLQGIFGLDSVSLGNASNGAVVGAVGSNGSISLGTGLTVNSCTTGPAGSIQTGPNASCASQVQQAAPFSLAAVDALVVNGNSFASAAASNNNVALGSYYTASGRTVTVNGKKTLTLPTGVYSFCSVSLGNGSTFSPAAGASVVIFIDSPLRSGSGCAAGTGTLSSGGNVTNGSAPASSFQFYVYGTGTDTATSSTASADFMLSQNATFTGTIYAPNSRVSSANQMVYNGAVAARWINFAVGSDFTADASTDTVSIIGPYVKALYRECSPAPATASDPESGC